MTAYFADIARQAAADGAISADEILQLRGAGWGDGKMEPAEAEALFALNDALADPTPEWSDFLAEAIVEYVVNTWAPRGYVTDEQAGWLIAGVSADGKLESMAELELLLKVLECAVNSPDSLKVFAIEQIERAVTTGTGPTRDGGSLADNCVTAAECRVLRRSIFARAGEGPASVSRREAEALFRIKDAALGAVNDPEWKRLFAQGVGNYLMGLVSRDAHIGRDRAIELETVMADSNHGTARFLARMLNSSPKDVVDALPFMRKALFGDGHDRMAELRAAEEVTPEERAWLDARVNADGEIDEYEQAVIEFIAGAAV